MSWKKIIKAVNSGNPNTCHWFRFLTIVFFFFLFANKIKVFRHGGYRPEKTEPINTTCKMCTGKNPARKTFSTLTYFTWRTSLFYELQWSIICYASNQYLYKTHSNFLIIWDIMFLKSMQCAWDIVYFVLMSAVAIFIINCSYVIWKTSF